VLSQCRNERSRCNLLVSSHTHAQLTQHAWFHLHPHSQLQEEAGREQTPVVHCGWKESGSIKAQCCIVVLQQMHGSPNKTFGNAEMSLAATAVVP